jgi:hypothetical protein
VHVQCAMGERTNGLVSGVLPVLGVLSGSKGQKDKSARGSRRAGVLRLIREGGMPSGLRTCISAVGWDLRR